MAEEDLKIKHQNYIEFDGLTAYREFPDGENDTNEE